MPLAGHGVILQSKTRLERDGARVSSLARRQRVHRGQNLSAHLDLVSFLIMSLVHDAHFRDAFAEAAMHSLRQVFPEVVISVRGDVFEIAGVPVQCDVEPWFRQWQKSGRNGHLVLVELEATLRKATKTHTTRTAPTELAEPEEATIVAYTSSNEWVGYRSRAEKKFASARPRARTSNPLLGQRSS